MRKYTAVVEPCMVCLRPEEEHTTAYLTKLGIKPHKFKIFPPTFQVDRKELDTMFEYMNTHPAPEPHDSPSAVFPAIAKETKIPLDRIQCYFYLIGVVAELQHPED